MSIERIAAWLSLAGLLLTTDPLYGGEGASCCLCRGCPPPLPAACTLPFDGACAGGCTALAGNEVVDGTTHECTAQPACPPPAAPGSPAAGGPTVSVMIGLLFAVVALRIMRQRTIRR